MSNHHSGRSIQLHYKQQADAEERRSQRNATRLRQYIEGKQVAMQYYLQDRAEQMLLGACMFVAIMFVGAGGLFWYY